MPYLSKISLYIIRKLVKLKKIKANNKYVQTKKITYFKTITYPTSI